MLHFFRFLERQIKGSTPFGKRRALTTCARDTLEPSEMYDPSGDEMISNFLLLRSWPGVEHDEWKLTNAYPVVVVVV